MIQKTLGPGSRLLLAPRSLVPPPQLQACNLVKCLAQGHNNKRTCWLTSLQLIFTPSHFYADHQA